MVVKRSIITVFNIIFPPVAVMLLTGLNADVILNCCLFLLAVIPSHIHGFYISLTYFNRKRKVRKGKYPGAKRPMIYSERVQTGGAGYREVRRLKAEKEEGIDGGKLSKRTSRMSSGSGNSSGSRIQQWDDGMSEKYVDTDSLSRQNTRRRNARAARRSQRSGVEYSPDMAETPSRRSSRSRRY